MPDRKKTLIKGGLTLFGESYPRKYLENLREFFLVLEAKGVARKREHRTLRFKTD